MNERLLELATRRGELMARIEMQRSTLAANTAPLETTLAFADQVAAGVSWVKQRPAIVAVGVAVLVVLRPSRAWRWGRRAYLVAQGLRGLRSKFGR